MSVPNVMKNNPRLESRFKTAVVRVKNGYTCETCHETTTKETIEKYYSDGEGNDQLMEEIADEYGCQDNEMIDLEVQYKCQTKDCEGYIAVSVDIDARSHYDVEYDSDEEDGRSTFNGWWGDVDILGIEGKAQDQIKKNTGVLDTVPIQLCIIAKTRFNAGFCYLGFSREDQCLIRPIYNTDVGHCCWSKNQELDLGRWYRFHAYSKQKDLTALPHSNDDLVVTNKYNEGSPVEDLYSLLEPFSKGSTREIFGTYYKFVNEGTDCPSLGVIKTQRKTLSTFMDNKNNMRIRFGNQDFRYTDLEAADLSAIPADDDVLLLVGLGRPWHWEGDSFKGTKRCYILGLGVISQNSKDIPQKRVSTEEDSSTPSTSKKIV